MGEGTISQHIFSAVAYVSLLIGPWFFVVSVIAGEFWLGEPNSWIVYASTGSVLLIGIGGGVWLHKVLNNSRSTLSTEEMPSHLFLDEVTCVARGGHRLLNRTVRVRGRIYTCSVCSDCQMWSSEEPSVSVWLWRTLYLISFISTRTAALVLAIAVSVTCFFVVGHMFSFRDEGTTANIWEHLKDISFFPVWGRWLLFMATPGVVLWMLGYTRVHFRSYEKPNHMGADLPCITGWPGTEGTLVKPSARDVRSERNGLFPDLHFRPHNS